MQGADEGESIRVNRNQAAMNPRQTVFDAKRLIGRRFDDAEVKKDMASWPFTVIDKEGSPFIEVRSYSSHALIWR
jgi:molecular chaperone DnaK (HSP70)